MTAIVKNINDYPRFVPVLNGAASALVAHRELRGQYVGQPDKYKKRKKASEQYYSKRTEGYYTNRSIKTWCCFFLLKALTTSGKLQNWTGRDNKLWILTWLQMNENSFRRRLAEMQELDLCGIDKQSNGSINIILTSYEKAAAILDIPFNGTTQLKYSPDAHQGKQIFRFFITAEEFRSEQVKQLEALTYWLNKNLSLKNDLHLLLLKFGADDKQLRNPVYFQQRLLALQMHLFKEGSEILSYVFSRRADINRSGKLIQDHHTYKSQQSVSYLKQRMIEHDIIGMQKICVESKERSRLYIPDGLQGRRDGYKWVDKKGVTAWFLTCQISFNYELQHSPKATAKKAA